MVHHPGLPDPSRSEAGREDEVVMVHRLHSDVAVRCSPDPLPTLSPSDSLQKRSRKVVEKHEKKDLV